MRVCFLQCPLNVSSSSRIVFCVHVGLDLSSRSMFDISIKCNGHPPRQCSTGSFGTTYRNHISLTSLIAEPHTNLFPAKFSLWRITPLPTSPPPVAHFDPHHRVHQYISKNSCFFHQQAALLAWLARVSPSLYPAKQLV